jgi:hypothetical protein
MVEEGRGDLRGIALREPLKAVDCAPESGVLLWRQVEQCPVAISRHHWSEPRPKVSVRKQAMSHSIQHDASHD